MGNIQVVEALKQIIRAGGHAAILYCVT